MKKIIFLFTTILIFAGFAACGGERNADFAEPGFTEPGVSEIRVAAMRGPTALGLLPLINAENNYEFQLLGSPDLVPPLLVQGEVDIAVVPGNLAAVLYNRLNVQALAVVTLGVLHIVDTTDTIHSVEDLRGRTIYAHGQGVTPEFALNYVLSLNGLTPGEDVEIAFRAEHAEVAALLQTGQAEIALLPEPFVSNVLAQIDGLRVALDLTEEWNRVQPDYGLIMSVVIARREFLQENPGAVTAFLEEYAASVQFVNTNVPEAAIMAAELELVSSAAVGEAAIPRSNIVFITGEEMRRNLQGFYQVLYDANPESVGGELPSNEFYFIP